MRSGKKSKQKSNMNSAEGMPGHLAFVDIDGDGNSYLSIEVVLDAPKLLGKLRKGIIDELKGIRRRYWFLQEMEEACSAIDRLEFTHGTNGRPGEGVGAAPRGGGPRWTGQGARPTMALRAKMTRRWEVESAHRTRSTSIQTGAVGAAEIRTRLGGYKPIDRPAPGVRAPKGCTDATVSLWWRRGDNRRQGGQLWPVSEEFTMPKTGTHKKQKSTEGLMPAGAGKEKTRWDTLMETMQKRKGADAGTSKQKPRTTSKHVKAAPPTGASIVMSTPEGDIACPVEKVRTDARMQRALRGFVVERLQRIRLECSLVNDLEDVTAAIDAVVRKEQHSVE